MTAAQILLIVIVIIPLGLVVLGRMRVDVAAISIAFLLGTAQFFGLPMLGPANQPEAAGKAIQGFGQPVVLTLLALFILTRALDQSGVTRWIAHRMLSIGGQSETRLIALFAGVTALLSLIMNNLAAGALILPTALEVARQTGIKPSKLLIPVAYGSLLGGSATYFTTANIIVSNLLVIANPPQKPLNLLDFTPTGGLIAIAGIAYLAFLGKRLLPDKAPAAEHLVSRPTGSELEKQYQLGERLWEARVLRGSPLIGKTLMQCQLGQKLGIAIAAIWHGEHAVFSPSPGEVLSQEDILVIVGREERIHPLEELGLQIGRENSQEPLSKKGVLFIEGVLAPHSKAEGKTLKELEFRSRYGFTAVAMWRGNRSYRTNVSDFPLQFGDSLLLVGTPQRLRALRKNPNFIILEPSLSDQPVDRRKAIISLGAILTGVAVSIAGFPVYLAMLAAAVFVILTSVISMEEAYQAIEWQAIFLIAGMYTVSLAMVQTDLSGLLGRGMLTLVRPFGPLGLGAGAYLLTALLTQLMGGQVTALVTGPVAISAAISMGTSPQAVAVATAIGCSASFFTPLAHPVNILMIAPANYTFGDFFRVGWLLTVISFAALLIGLVVFWGL